MTFFRTERSTSHRLPSAVYALGAGVFLLGTSEFMIAGLLPVMARDLHRSLSDTGLLISAFALGMVIGAPLMSVITLRLPRRLTLAAALTVFAAGHVLAAVTSSYDVVLVARVVTAVATGTFWSVAAVVVTAVVPVALRARGLGVLIGGLTVANVVGVPLGTWLGDSFGWRTPFAVLAVGAVLAVAVVVPLVPRAAEDEARPVLRHELAAFRQPRVWLGLLTIALLQGGVFGAFSYVSPLLTDVAGIGAGVVPVVLALFGLGALIGSQLGGRLGDARPWAVLLIALGATVVVFVLLSLAAGAAPLAIALVAAYGVTAFTAAPLMTSRVIGLAGGAPTLASAMSTSAFNVGNAVGPFLGGVALSAAGLRAPLVVGAVLVSGALGVALVSLRSDHAAAARVHADAAAGIDAVPSGAAAPQHEPC